jgi:hypothetical protein
MEVITLTEEKSSQLHTDSSTGREEREVGRETWLRDGETPIFKNRDTFDPNNS